MNKKIKGWLRRQKIVITGGTGKLGRSLTRRLLESGANKIVVTGRNAKEYEEESSFSDAAAVSFISCDILAMDELEKVFKGCTVVFHLAALKHAGLSHASPVEYSKVNALGTVHVLEACRKCGVEKVVYVSTAHVYGKPQNSPVTEVEQTNPLSLYAASKLAGEVFVQGYAAQHGIHAVIARMSNLYGPSFGEDTVLGKAVQQVVTKQPIKLHDLRPVRDFIYIDDAINALLNLSVHEFEESCLIVNVSTGRGISISEAVSCLSDIAVKMGLPKPEIIEPEAQGTLDLPVLTFSNELLCKITNWQPEKTLVEGLTSSLHSKLKIMNN